MGTKEKPQVGFVGFRVRILIYRSWATFAHPNNPRNGCAESLRPFPFTSEWGKVVQERKFFEIKKNSYLTRLIFNILCFKNYSRHFYEI